jgi:hypothetical protein
MVVPTLGVGMCATAMWACIGASLIRTIGIVFVARKTTLKMKGMKGMKEMKIMKIVKIVKSR